MKNRPVFNLCYNLPAFRDIAEVTRYGLASLGFPAYLNQSAVMNESNAINVIFCSHLIKERSTIPDGSILFNLEQLESDSIYCKPEYFDLLSRHIVWDYSKKNIDWLSKTGVNNSAKLISIGFAPSLERIVKPVTQDIDILFYGAVNERRQAILNKLTQFDLKVIWLKNVYGNELDSYIARSKVVLNIHFYSSKIFEIVRASYLLNNKKAVVSELDDTTEIDDDIRQAVVGVPYDKLVENCLELVENEPLRLQVEKNGYRIFSSRSQAVFMKEAVNDLASHSQKNTEKSAISMNIQETILRRTTPIIVNSFNQYTYLKNIIEKLFESGFENIYILDQGSTYPPLMDWLAGVYERREALPLYLPENYGPRYFFLSGLYRIFGEVPLIYTDPDLSWNKLAPDFLSRLFDLSHKHQAFKIGPALDLPDPQDLKEVKIKILNPHGQPLPDIPPFSLYEWESQYWKNELEPGVFDAKIDTTFHLFVPKYYTPEKSLISGMRVAGEGYSFIHLPWYKFDPMPEEEYAYYISRSKYSTTDQS